MAMTTNYLAYDLGASSGRAVLGRFDGARLDIEEIHRFPNRGIPIGNSYYWDALRLFDEMRTGLRLALRSGEPLSGMGCDTWGVDYGLLDAHDNLLGNPYCYRDTRTQGMLGKAFERVSRKAIFEQTGIQFMELNTLYQLLAQRLAQSPQLDMARTFLTMPDLFNFWFTGQKVCEYSNATTTQFYNPRQRAWATEMLRALDIPTGMLLDVVPPGTVLGPIRKTIADDMGIPPIDVIAPACHDTGSAVAAAPMSSADAVYISCGTWALMGAELTEPAINEKALAHNFTNEGGVDNTIRFLKNISGLWIVQECRRVWALAGNDYSWEQLMALALDAEALASFIDPDHADFGTPGDMPARIRDFCTRTHQIVPDSEGAIIRTALESLALKCRSVLSQLEDALGKPLADIHIVGGGIHNTLLCQFIASATGRAVLSGPAEATAMGNLLMQAMGKGQIASLDDLRAIVRASTPIKTYRPTDADAWAEAFEKFQGIGE